MSDIIWLTLMLQFPLACVSVVPKWHGMSDKVIFGLALVAVCVYAWSLSVAALSGLGINGLLRRGLFLVIVLPTAMFGSVAPLVGFVAMTGDNGLVQREVAAVGLVAMVALCFGCRRLTAWVVADPARDEGAPPMEKLSE
ncbi:MAG: hypothetical protein V3R99_02705 [Thermoguttaceae bacterium]